MSDDTSKRDQRDRDRVAGGQDYEVSYLMEKHGVSREQVQDAIRAVGNDREKIEEYLSGNRKR